MEDITDADYTHAKAVSTDFERKSLGEYNDLYIQCNPLLLADVFENFRNMCLEIYELDHILMNNIFLNLMFNIFKNYLNFVMIYHFYQKE